MLHQPFPLFTLTLQKSRMPQIQGTKGEAISIHRDCEPLATEEMQYHPVKSGKGKQRGGLFIVQEWHS
jgi:hypothetical protein